MKFVGNERGGLLIASWSRSCSVPAEVIISNEIRGASPETFAENTDIPADYGNSVDVFSIIRESTTIRRNLRLYLFRKPMQAWLSGDNGKIPTIAPFHPGDSANTGFINSSSANGNNSARLRCNTDARLTSLPLRPSADFSTVLYD